MTRVVAGGAAALLLITLAAATGRTQERAESAVLPALLTEVRGLRAAIERMATSGAQVQLALGRLQLQEQRVNTAIGRLDETRTRLASLQRRVADEEDQLAMMESALKAVGSAPSPEQANERTAIESALTHHRRQIVRSRAEIQQLAGEEAALSSDVAGEQARWSTLNARLEELERTLKP